MKHLLVFIGFLFFYFGVFSQNLVPNGDFEYCTQIPYHLSQITFAKPWFCPTKEYICMSDYFHANSPNPYVSVPHNGVGGFQYARSGLGYAWIPICAPGLEAREYIEIRLLDSLQSNTCYHCSFWLNLVDECQYRSLNVQAYFSKDSVIDTTHLCTNLSLIPQVIYSGPWIDTISWFHFDETFVANGGEQFITIGNFLDDSHSVVELYNTGGWGPEVIYYIDDVAVYPCDAPIVSAQAGEDTEICPGDNITLGMPHYDYYKYKWFELDGTIIDTNNSITVSSQIETTYVLWIKDFLNQESYDTVTVRIKDCSPEPSVEIPNVFTPNGDGHNDKFKVQGYKIEKINMLVYNRWGNKVFEGNEPDAAWDGTYNGQKCGAGVYYYVAEITFTGGKTESRKGTVTLLR